MAALNLPKCATNDVHESVQVQIPGAYNNTCLISGILFLIQAKRVLPVEKITIRSLAVRGHFGPLTVWVTKVPPHETRAGAIFQPLEENHNYNTNNVRGHRRSLQAQSDVLTVHAPTYTHRDRRRYYHFRLSSNHWDKIYEKTHAASGYKYDTLDLSACPIVLFPGQVRAIYIHSDKPSIYCAFARFGAAAVAARAVATPRYQDSMIAMWTGKGQDSSTPFGRRRRRGFGSSLVWYENIEFVGHLQYGVVFRLWNPMQYPTFGANFGKAVRALLMMQHQNHEGHWHHLPDECIFHILNMCRWDWFDDTAASMLLAAAANKRRRRRLHMLAAAREERERQTQHLPGENAAPTESKCHKHTVNDIAVVENDATNAMAVDADNNDDAGVVEEAAFQRDNEVLFLLNREYHEEDSDGGDEDDDDDEAGGNESDTEVFFPAYHEEDSDGDDEDDDDDEVGGNESDSGVFGEYLAGDSDSDDEDDDDDEVGGNKSDTHNSFFFTMRRRPVQPVPKPMVLMTMIDDNN